MREIKFRGKTLATNEWVYGFYTVIAGYCNITPIGCSEFEYSIVIPETVGQFTGLLDKNGIEVYEGDLIDFPQLLKPSKPTTVEWENAGWKYLIIHTTGKYEIEIVGNIHDTELLKQ